MMSCKMKTGSATAWRQNVAQAKLENQVFCIDEGNVSHQYKSLMLAGNNMILPDNCICPIMNVLEHGLA